MAFMMISRLQSRVATTKFGPEHFISEFRKRLVAVWGSSERVDETASAGVSDETPALGGPHLCPSSLETSGDDHTPTFEGCKCNRNRCLFCFSY
ncbi:hypothetical protein MUK42_14853 [Musa troglodytarum]|uniref:Uncharacterized protein n=1 Tax=Musa troglodytarum TaxID=320322 RepID=A0A9E7I8G4_9LILI|nr:hypothetical protein MUK42_14853 [Musa troglodytarum]